jgi:two-component system chemotaxis response regulator CheB
MDAEVRPAGAVVVVGASSGGVEALCRLVEGLPRDLQAAVLVVLHHSPSSPSVLPRILSRCGPLPAAHARDGEKLLAGRIYVAPPDQHLLVEAGHARLSRGPRENGVRPAVDTLFRSAAASYAEAAVGVVLSGMLDDGTAGLIEVKRRGGLTMAQDPSDSIAPDMPMSAARFASPDHIAAAAALAGLVAAAIRRLAAAAPAAPPTERPTELDARPSGSEGLPVTSLEPEPFPDAATSNQDVASGLAPDPASAHVQAGAVSAFTCPECGGTLWEDEQGDFVRFHCRVGHAYGPESLDAAQLESLEQSLWAAMVALEERGDLCSKLASRFRARSLERPARHYDVQAADALRRAQIVRQAITRLSEPSADDDRSLTSEGPSLSGRDLSGDADV